MSKLVVKGKGVLSFLMIAAMVGCNPPVPNEVRPEFPPTEQIRDQTPVDIYDKLLLRHVNRRGDVHYKGFQADSSEFNVYCDFLSSQNPEDNTWTETDKLAFWINVYNAHVIRIIIRHYPIASVADIGRPQNKLEPLVLMRDSLPETLAVFDEPFIQVGDVRLSLNEVKMKIRESFDDPRIHFVLVDGSVSAPRLQRGAFRTGDLLNRLDNAALNFFELPGKNFISPTKPQLSLLFREYGDDFTGEKTLYDFINSYSKVKIRPDAAIVFLDYNWKLNGY